MIKLEISLAVQLLRVNFSIFLITKEAFRSHSLGMRTFFLYIYLFKQYFYHRKILHCYKFGYEKVMTRKEHDEEGKATKVILITHCLRLFKIITDISVFSSLCFSSVFSL